MKISSDVLYTPKKGKARQENKQKKQNKKKQDGAKQKNGRGQQMPNRYESGQFPHCRHGIIVVKHCRNGSKRKAGDHGSDWQRQAIEPPKR